VSTERRLLTREERVAALVEMWESTLSTPVADQSPSLEAYLAAPWCGKSLLRRVLGLATDSVASWSGQAQAAERRHPDARDYTGLAAEGLLALIHSLRRRRVPTSKALVWVEFASTAPDITTWLLLVRMLGDATEMITRAAQPPDVPRARGHGGPGVRRAVPTARSDRARWPPPGVDRPNSRQAAQRRSAR
jgi:hypothetical protein